MKPADKARHDKLVGLVDKMLGLMPKLRAVVSDTAKAPLQNAVTAADQQIDALAWGPLRFLTSAPTVAETANELECTPIDSMRCSGVS